MDRGTRRHHRERVIRTRAKFYLNTTGDQIGYAPGRLAKRKPLDCGKAQCWLCHYEPSGHPRKRNGWYED